MAATLAQRAEAAKKEIASLKEAISSTLQSKSDSTLFSAAENQPLASIRNPGSIKCRRTLKGHFGKITALDWSKDGNLVVSASQDGNLLLWDAVTTTKKQAIRLKSAYVMSVCMENSGRFVAAGGLDNACSIYKIGGPDGSPSQLQTELVSHEGYLASCKFFHSPSKMLTASADATALLWDVQTGQIITSFGEHKSNVTEVRLVDSDPNLYLSASTDKTIKLWDVRASKQSAQTFVGHAGDVNGITFLGDTGLSFASCSEDGTVGVWDVRAYRQIARFGTLMEATEVDPFSDGDNGFTSITSSKSGRLVFCGHSEGSVVCYDVLSPSADPCYVLKNVHDEHISCVGISPVGDALCTGSWDFQLKIFA